MQRVRGLDGLRALAVIGVLLYHADLSGVPGGFLGVDVFFVLSGYLITSLLLREWRKTGRLDFKAFYLARARRLLPGLGGLLIGTGAAALIWAPDAVATLRRQLVPAAAYFLNWSSIYSHSSYFEQTGRPPLLLHLWSLAVEEQFYLLWPIVALAILRRNRGRNPRRALRKVAMRGALLSAAWMAFLAVRHGFPVPNDPSRAYYGTDTHASGLLLGAALACVWPMGALPRLVRYERTLFDITGLAALAGTIWLFHTTSEYSTWLYRGGFILYPAIFAVLIAVVAHPECRLGRLLAIQPIRWVGERSYGIYLWHWPVFMLTRPSLDIGLTGTPNLLLRLAITGVLAELSWRFIEIPVRNGAIGRLVASLRAYGARRAAATHRTVLGASVSFGLAAVLIVSILTLDRPPAAASAAGFDTPPPPPAPAALSPSPTPSAATTPSPAPSVTPNPPGATPVATHTVLPPPATSKPATTPPPATLSSVTAWGDSVMLGASYAIRDLMPNVYIDAVVGRQAGVLPAGITELRSEGHLGKTVIIHVGDNGLFLRSSLTDALDNLKDRRRVVIVTVRVPRRWQDPVNELLRSVASEYRNVRIADWYQVSAGHPEYFVSDGVHLTYAGCSAFANTIAQAAK